MIISGRSPNTRHVSGTHRVDLDWLFERINLDNSSSKQYQLADILTRHVKELLSDVQHGEVQNQRRRQDKGCTARRWTGSRPHCCWTVTGDPTWQWTVGAFWNGKDPGTSNEEAQGWPRWTVEEISPTLGGSRPKGHCLRKARNTRRTIGNVG